jgi:hypothetical protein
VGGVSSSGFGYGSDGRVRNRRASVAMIGHHPGLGYGMDSAEVRAGAGAGASPGRTLPGWAHQRSPSIVGLAPALAPASAVPPALLAGASGRARRGSFMSPTDVFAAVGRRPGSGSAATFGGPVSAAPPVTGPEPVYAPARRVVHSEMARAR